MKLFKKYNFKKKYNCFMGIGRKKSDEKQDFGTVGAYDENPKPVLIKRRI